MKKWLSFAAICVTSAALLCLVLKYNEIHNFVRSTITATKYAGLMTSSDTDSKSNAENSELIRKIYLANNGINITAENNEPKNNVEKIFLMKNFTHLRTQYAVISVSTPLDNNYNYVFYAPLTVLAWQRIGFQTVVIVSGSEADWMSHHVLNTVRKYLTDLNAVVLFLDSKPENRVMISQVSRLFAASLLENKLRKDDFLILSDADLWPLNQSMYSLKAGYQILSLNSDCCGSFDYNGKSYKMLPMANVGASLATWLDVVGTSRFLPKSVDDILTYFEREFGSVARLPVHKGENLGWYMDQRMTSILVQEWSQRNNTSSIQFVPRDVGGDRIDRAWYSAKTIVNKTDAHVLENAYDYRTWFQLTPLLRLMYGEESNVFSFCMQYFEDFVTALREHERQNQ